MPIKYYKLFDILQRRELKKTDLLKIANISSPTLAKLSKGETVTTEVIEKICKALDTQPGEIMEYLKDASTTSNKPQEPNITTEQEEHILLPWEE